MTDTTDSKANNFDADLRKLVEQIAKRRKQPKRQGWDGLILATLLAASIPFVMLWHGYVLAKLWAWFIEPVFHISLPIFFATGMALFARLLVRAPLYSKPFSGMIVPLISLGCGALWHWLGWGL
jgi:hypothetical protein